MSQTSATYDNPAALVERLDEFVKHDGAAFEVTEVDAETRAVSLRLVLDDVECLDCVMPRDYLEQLSLTTLREVLPDLARVTIDDPREQG